VGAVLSQALRLVEIAHPDDETDTAPAAGFDAGDSVLEDDTSGWPHTQAPRGFQEHRRIRLARQSTAREVYRNEWTGLTEPLVVQGALETLEELGWIRREAVSASRV